MTAMYQPVDRNKGKVEAELFHKGWPCGAAPRLSGKARHYLVAEAPGRRSPVSGPPGYLRAHCRTKKQEGFA